MRASEARKGVGDDLRSFLCYAGNVIPGHTRVAGREGNIILETRDHVGVVHAALPEDNK